MSETVTLFAHRPGLLAACIGVLWTALPAKPVLAADLDKEIEKRTRQATVQVWMGEAQQGNRDIKRLGSGSGSFVNRTGLVITNNHVVDPGHGKDPRTKLEMRLNFSLLKYRVVINGGTEQEKEYEARILYQNEAADLALLQVEDHNGEPLDPPHHLPILPSHGLEKGYRVWLFGFPGGDKMSTSKGRHAAVTVSSGNITDVPRTPGGRIPAIETDVKAAPGNSGGPLVNVEGHMVGVVSQISAGAGGGSDDSKGDGVDSRVIPGDLVFEIIKVALALGKVSSKTDVEPFLHLLADKQGRVVLPGIERVHDKATVVMQNGDQIVGTITDQQWVCHTALGSFTVPVRLAGYAVREGDKINLLLDGGDRLAADAADLSVTLETSQGTTTTRKLSDVAKIAFKNPSTDLEVPDLDAILIEGDGCRVFLKEAEGSAIFKTAGEMLELKLEDLKLIETEDSKQVIHTADGSTHSGRFQPHAIAAKTAWTNTPVSISLEKLRSATIRLSNPARAGRTIRSLAKRLAIDQPEIVELADLLQKAEVNRALALLEDRSTRSALKGKPGPVKEQIKVLHAEALLRNGQYEQAAGGFKKLRRAKLENVKWYATSRYEILDSHSSGGYQGKSLSEPKVFQSAADDAAEEIIARARATLNAYSKAMPDKHNAWKSLIRQLEKHEQELRVADSLDPGSAENDIFRIWRFTQDLNVHEFRRLLNELEQVRRKAEDFKSDGTRSSVQRAQSIQKKLERITDQMTDVGRLGEDTQKRMSQAGFRLDDPAAADILTSGGRDAR